MTVVAPLVFTIPLIVILVACEVARREGTPIPWRRVLVLAVATIAAVAASPLLRHPASLVVTFVILFAGFGFPVTQAIEKAAKARLTEPAVRTASLVPRRVSMYVPLPLRVVSIAATLAACAWVAMRATPAIMLVGYAFGGLTFFGLYEVWMRQEVAGVRARDEDDRRQRVRAIFAAQTVLTLSFLSMAALSAGNWPGLLPLAVMGGIIGSIGCALALSTDIQQRYLRR